MPMTERMLTEAARVVLAAGLGTAASCLAMAQTSANHARLSILISEHVAGHLYFGKRVAG